MIIKCSYKYISILFVFVFIQIPVYATTCSKSYTLGFFNGVWNTQQQAIQGRKELKILIGTIYNNEPVKYETFYNHTGGSVDATPLQDLAETFIQRSVEIDASGELGKRFEYFWEFLGSSEPTFLDKLVGFFPNAASLFESLYTSITAKLTSIISYFLSHPPTEADYVAHNAQLDALAADGQKLMLVAHSQGNLFMNHAYDHIVPIVTKDRVAAAHIAPASPTLRGDWVLADIDLVINALRVQGVSSVPENNLMLPASKVDYSGHTLISTYLDPTREGRGRLKTMIEREMEKLNFCLIFDWRKGISINKTVLAHRQDLLTDLIVHRNLSAFVIPGYRAEAYKFGSGIEAYNNAQAFYLSLPLDPSLVHEYILNYNLSQKLEFLVLSDCKTTYLDRFDLEGNLYALRREDLLCYVDVYKIFKE